MYMAFRYIRSYASIFAFTMSRIQRLIILPFLSHVIHHVFVANQLQDSMCAH